MRKARIACVLAVIGLGLSGCHDGYYSGSYRYRSSTYLGPYGCDDGYGYGHGWWPSWSLGISYADYGGHHGHGGHSGHHGGYGGGHGGSHGGGHGGGHRR